MKRSIYPLILFSFIAAHCLCQSLRRPIAVTYNNLSAYSTQQVNVLSCAANQGALAQAKNAAAGVYGERRFLLAATSLYAAAVAVPTAKGNFCFNLLYSGFKNFNESELGLAYARSLGEKVDLGIQFNYYSYQVPSYGGSSTVTVEMGAVMHLTQRLNLGLHVYNPAGGKFSKTDEKLTTAVATGLGYDVNDHFFAGIEIVKEENFPVNVNAGIQYQFMKQFFARTGIATASATGYAGFGVAWSNLRLDVTGSYHPQLGLSPGLLLIMTIGKQEKATVNAEPYN